MVKRLREKVPCLSDKSISKFLLVKPCAFFLRYNMQTLSSLNSSYIDSSKKAFDSSCLLIDS